MYSKIKLVILLCWSSESNEKSSFYKSLHARFRFQVVNNNDNNNIMLLSNNYNKYCGPRVDDSAVDFTGKIAFWFSCVAC